MNSDIERSSLSLVLQTPSKSFRHYSLPRVVGGDDVGSKKHALKEKGFQIFSSPYILYTGMVLGQTDMSSLKYK
jgi:hypothetical protein